MRRVPFALTVLVGSMAVGCGGAGSISSAGEGRVKDVLHSTAETRQKGSFFGGMAVSPDGTVFLSTVDDDITTPEHVRILILRRGEEPKIFASENQLLLPGVDRIEARLLALGQHGELLVVGFADRTTSVIGLDPKGRSRLVASLPVARRATYGLVFTALAADPRDGSLYLAENCRIFRVRPGQGFEVFAGEPGQEECSVEGGEPLLRRFFRISGLFVDPRSGALYVGDSGRVYRIEGSGVTAVAGRAGYEDRGIPGFSGDGGPATDARLDRPGAMALDPAGDLYIADLRNQRIRKVDRAGTITTAVGNGNFRRPYEGPATDVAVDATQLGIDSEGHFWATALSRVSPDDIWSERLVTTTLGPS